MPHSMIIFWRFFVFIAMTGLFTGELWSADKKVLQGKEVLAEMGKLRLTVDQLRELLDLLAPEERQQVLANPALLEKLAGEELVKQYLIAQAKREGLDRKAIVKQAMARAAEQALLSRYMQAHTVPDADFPDDARVREAYEKNKAKLNKSDRVHLLQLYVAMPIRPEARPELAKKVAELHTRLKTEDFSELAKVHSEHKISAEKGGDLGWVELSAIQTALRPAIVALKPGEISQVIATEQGWHILKLVEREAGKPLTLEEARPGLQILLRRGAVKEKESALLSETLRGTPLRMNAEILKKIIQDSAK